MQFAVDYLMIEFTQISTFVIEFQPSQLKSKVALNLHLCPKYKKNIVYSVYKQLKKKKKKENKLNNIFQDFLFSIHFSVELVLVFQTPCYYCT